jgi:hypothetical protein
VIKPHVSKIEQSRVYRYESAYDANYSLFIETIVVNALKEIWVETKSTNRPRCLDSV